MSGLAVSCSKPYGCLMRFTNASKELGVQDRRGKGGVRGRIVEARAVLKALQPTVNGTIYAPTGGDEAKRETQREEQSDRHTHTLTRFCVWLQV